MRNSLSGSVLAERVCAAAQSEYRNSMTSTSTGFASVTGLHHVTAIAGEPDRSVAFYTGLLGLRLVKRTVNFDDPTAYHLYVGNETGAPGTLLTFFYWRNDYSDARGRIGVGAVAALTLSIPRGSRTIWQDRLAAAGVATRTGDRFGEPLLSFSDPDRIPIELAESVDDRRPWNGTDVPETYAITGLHAAPLLVRKAEATEAMLEAGLGMTRIAAEPGRTRWAAGAARPGNIVDVLVAGVHTPEATVGIGTVHHVALRALDGDAQERLRNRLQSSGHAVSPLRDRQYFRSIYFREPGGVMGEIATDGPGFAVDECPSRLGTSLRLPPQFEAQRDQIIAALPPLILDT
jgi:glyoxalase family protein